MKKPIKYFCAVLILYYISGFNYSIFAQETSQEARGKVDQIFSEFINSGSPGASVAVFKNGEIIFKNGYGLANLEYDIPVTPSTIFHVASVSKQFTAFVIADLAEKGKISLDDDIRKLLPEVPDFGQTITIRHLIHHISGLRDQWELLSMAGWRLDDVITKEHIMKMVKHQKELNFEPGSRYLYCNTGYTLLAEIVSRVTGKSFPQYTNEAIFEPLGMFNTHFHDDHEKIVQNRAYSYYIDENYKFRKSVLSYANAGATSLFTTVEDLSKWIRNFETCKVGGSSVIEQILKKGILNSGREIRYAFGLSHGKYKGLNTISHSGGDAGFRSFLVHFPEYNYGIAVLSNLASFSPSGAAYKVADIFLKDYLEKEKPEEKADEIVEERKFVKIDPEILKRYTGKFRLQNGFVFEIAVEADRLKIGEPGEQKFEMLPESETKFYVKTMSTEILFQEDSSGKYHQFLLKRTGGQMTGKKIEEEKISSDHISEFTGDYYSEELGTAYTIVVKNNSLIAVHRRHNDIFLSFSEKDNFMGNRWFFRRVNFIRNEDNKITGFKLTGSRVWNLKFEKIK
jgi:CubicO group peptidase (beta-lactamase class C family)